MDSVTRSLQVGVGAGAPPLLGVLLRALVLKYFSQYYSFCSVGRDDFIGDVPLGRLRVADDGGLEGNLRRAVENGCQAFVVEEPAILRVLDLFVPVHDASGQRSLDKRMVLLVSERNRWEVFDRLVAQKALREILNVLIVVYDDDATVTTCYTTWIKHEGAHVSFNVGFRKLSIDWSDWERATFFPDKSRDLDGYVLRMASCNYLPFAGFTRVEPGLGNAYDSETGERSIWLDGTELQLVLSFCQKRNCSILLFPEEEDEWGEIYPNGSGIGLLGSVASRRTDIALAAIYLWYTPYNFTAYTASISRSGVTVLVPKPRALPFWRTPFLSFSWPMWTAVAVTFVLGSLATWATVRGRHRLLEAISAQEVAASERSSLSEVVMMMIGFFVAQSSAVRNDLWSCVLLFSSLLLAGFMVSNLYSAGLASVMTVPQYERSIDTVLDFAASGMQWFGPTPYCLEEIDNATEPHLVTIRSTYKVASTSEARQHAHAVDSGFIMEQAQHGNFAPSEYLDRDSSTSFQVLRDDIYFQNCIALMTKTNPLRYALNEYIMQVQQSGILYHWGTMTAIRFLPTVVFRNIEQARSHRNDAGHAVTLHIDHFLGAFLILGFGLSFAALILIGELRGAVLVTRWNRFCAGERW